MIGWGWVVHSGNWITRGGVIGAALGFVIGGIMIYFVGRTYAELISAMPKCGGEHVYSFKAMGSFGSYVCTWAIVLGYVSVVCFESCTIPLIFQYIYPNFMQIYLYTIAGYDIYATWVLTSVAIAIAITYINVRGVKMAARLQTLLTVIIAGVGVILVIASVFEGETSNLQSHMFIGTDAKTGIFATLAVAMTTPFFFIGFDVIPQAASEIKVPLQKIGKIMLLSIALAVIFYVMIIISTGLIMNTDQIAESMSNSGLVTADALAIALNSEVASKVILLGGLCGIITSWNSFMIGGSRAIYSMAESNMVPHIFAKCSSKYKTPVAALVFIGILSALSSLLGKGMLIWIVDAGNLGCCLAYLMVALSFMILRKKDPNMPRPYFVKHYKLVGTIAVVMSLSMVLMYMIPGTSVTLAPIEWCIVGGWAIMGVIFGLYCKIKYKEFKKPYE